MIWNPNKECMSREQMRELQGKRLQKLVQYVYHNVPLKYLNSFVNFIAIKLKKRKEYLFPSVN